MLTYPFPIFPPFLNLETGSNPVILYYLGFATRTKILKTEVEMKLDLLVLFTVVFLPHVDSPNRLPPSLSPR